MFFMVSWMKYWLWIPKGSYREWVVKEAHGVDLWVIFLNIRHDSLKNHFYWQHDVQKVCSTVTYQEANSKSKSHEFYTHLHVSNTP